MVELSGVVERPVLFGETLVGVLTRPATSSTRELPAVVFLNAGIVHRIGPHRLYVRLARALAGVGVVSLRFDLPGVGDSNVPLGRAGDTVATLVDRSIDAALDYLDSQGQRKGFIVLGLCSGADNAFHAATRDDRVVGAVLLDPNTYRTTGYYLHLWGRKLFRASSWLNILTGRHPYMQALSRRLLRRPSEADEEWPFLAPTTLPPRETMRRQFEHLVERQVQLCCIFTAGLKGRYNHEKQFLRTYPGLEFKGLLHYEYWPDSDHTFSCEHLRTRLTSTLLNWVTETVFAVPLRIANDLPAARTPSP